MSPNQRSSAPERSQASCHDTMLEWCSISVITTLSPGPSSIVRASRLSASVAFLVKITSLRDGALRKLATWSRAAS